MKTIVTHTSPDFDAIMFVRLMIRFADGFGDAEIKFIPLNAIERERKILDAADAVGDMGKEYDPDRLRFDHHHFPGAQSTATCAAKLAWEWLISQGQNLEYLAPLIEEIHQGDLARTPLVGIHSQMFGWKASAKEAGIILSDGEIYSYGAHILSQIEFWLKHKAEARAELAEKVVWKSEDNSVWAVRHGSVSSTFSAYDEGARVVIFEGEPLTLNGGEITYPMGASRAPEWNEPDLGLLVQRSITSDTGLKKELGKWFRHPAGFYAGRGGPKAPDQDPPKADLVEVAKAFHKNW